MTHSYFSPVFLFRQTPLSWPNRQWVWPENLGDSKNWNWMTRQRLSSSSQIEPVFLMLSPLLSMLALPALCSWPVLANLVSWFQITWLLTSIFQLSAILLTWKSDALPLSTSTWPLNPPKLFFVPLFSPSWTIVFLFYLGAHWSIWVDYRKFRTLQWN